MLCKEARTIVWINIFAIILDDIYHVPKNALHVATPTYASAQKGVDWIGFVHLTHRIGLLSDVLILKKKIRPTVWVANAYCDSGHEFVNIF